MSETSSGFHRLWPTLLLRRALPDTEHANSALAALMLERDAASDQLTTGYLDADVFELKHPAIEWLRACVRRTVTDYLAEGVGRPVEWYAQGWINVNRRGDYHGLHNHPHSYLSGTYYVAVPEQPADAGRRDDLDPGAISLYDPRPQANMNAVLGDGQIQPEHRVVPEPGLMLLWPSFLHHAVHPNFADAPRLSISFNVLLARQRDHVPGLARGDGPAAAR